MRIMEGQARVATRAIGVNDGGIVVQVGHGHSGGGTIGHVAVMAMGMGHRVRLKAKGRGRHAVTVGTVAKVRVERNTGPPRHRRHCRKCRRLSFRMTKAWTRLRGRSR